MMPRSLAIDVMTVLTLVHVVTSEKGCMTGFTLVENSTLQIQKCLMVDVQHDHAVLQTECVNRGGWLPLPKTHALDTFYYDILSRHADDRRTGVYKCSCNTCGVPILPIGIRTPYTHWEDNDTVLYTNWHHTVQFRTVQFTADECAAMQVSDGKWIKGFCADIFGANTNTDCKWYYICESEFVKVDDKKDGKDYTYLFAVGIPAILLLMVLAAYYIRKKCMKGAAKKSSQESSKANPASGSDKNNADAPAEVGDDDLAADAPADDTDAASAKKKSSSAKTQSSSAKTQSSSAKTKSSSSKAASG